MGNGEFTVGSTTCDIAFNFLQQWEETHLQYCEYGDDVLCTIYYPDLSCVELAFLPVLCPW